MQFFTSSSVQLDQTCTAAGKEFMQTMVQVLQVINSSHPTNG